MYDEIVNLYHLIYADWPSAIKRQATALNTLFIELLGQQRNRVLDISCGIGTQSLGLAALDYEVTASDISAASITRAKREAIRAQLDIDFSVMDMRNCGCKHAYDYDIVLSADNSLPHLRKDDIRVTIEGMFSCLRPGGFAVVGIRDYESETREESTSVKPYGFRKHEGSQYYIYQTRNWVDDLYKVSMYFVRECNDKGKAEVTAGSSIYYAISVDEVIAIFLEVGFSEVRRIDNVMHQPLIIGRRPA